MASQTRQAREADRKLSVQTLAIASISSAVAAIIVSQFWKGGTAPAAAVTPVVVSVISELLHKPTQAITSRVTADRAAVLPEGAGAGAPAQQTRSAVTVPATDTEAAKPFSEERPPPLHDEDGDTRPSDARPTREAPVSYHKAGANGSSAKPGRRFPVKVVAATAALAFLIGAAILTVPELIAGESVGKSSGGTTLFGGDRSSTQDSDTRSQDTKDSQQQQDQPSDQNEQPSGKSDENKDPSETQKQKTTETDKQSTPQQQGAPTAPKSAPAQP